MPRQPIYLDQSVLDRLRKYTKNKYGNRRALSIVVQLAVERYLNVEEIKGVKQKQAAGSYRAETL